MDEFKKLMLIQSKLKAPKGQTNTFGKYKYRNCEDILEAVKPLLLEHNCTLFISDSLENIGERYYIKATVTFVDTETGKAIQNTSFAREEESKKGMDGSQVSGASSSYARKYALNGLFGIDDTKDSDSTNAGQEQSKKEYKCKKCGKAFAGFTDKNKKSWNAGQVYHMAESTAKERGFDGAYCGSCLKELGGK